MKWEEPRSYASNTRLFLQSVIDGYGRWPHSSLSTTRMDDGRRYSSTTLVQIHSWTTFASTIMTNAILVLAVYIGWKNLGSVPNEFDITDKQMCKITTSFCQKQKFWGDLRSPMCDVPRRMGVLRDRSQVKLQLSTQWKAWLPLLSKPTTLALILHRGVLGHKTRWKSTMPELAGAHGNEPRGDRALPNGQKGTVEPIALPCPWFEKSRACECAYASRSLRWKGLDQN